jgi:hypothetical protein
MRVDPARLNHLQLGLLFSSRTERLCIRVYIVLLVEAADFSALTAALPSRLHSEVAVRIYERDIESFIPMAGFSAATRKPNARERTCWRTAIGFSILTRNAPHPPGGERC